MEKEEGEDGDGDVSMEMKDAKERSSSEDDWSELGGS